MNFPFSSGKKKMSHQDTKASRKRLLSLKLFLVPWCRGGETNLPFILRKWRRAIQSCLCAILFASLLFGAEDFQWDWRHAVALTAKQTLRHAKVSSADRLAISKAIALALMPDMGGLGGRTEPELEDTALDTPVKLVDLNGDGTPEVIAQGTPEDGGCSPDGNCRFWVFQKSGDGYQPLIALTSIQSFTIQQRRLNGFNDLVVKTQVSSAESTLKLLQYNDGRYQEVGCYEADWSAGGDGRTSKEPRLTPCGAGH
jgi:hypothetical protein